MVNVSNLGINIQKFKFTDQYSKTKTPCLQTTEGINNQNDQKVKLSSQHSTQKYLEQQ